MSRALLDILRDMKPLGKTVIAADGSYIESLGEIRQGDVFYSQRQVIDLATYLFGTDGDQTELELLRIVFENARSFLRYNGIDRDRVNAAVDAMDRSVEDLKQFDGGTYDPPEPAAMPAPDYHAILRRAAMQLVAWSEVYGESDHEFLPPAGHVNLLEDIREALKSDANPAALRMRLVAQLQRAESAWQNVTILDRSRMKTEARLAALEGAVVKISEEWQRQKALFPVMETDGWMSLAIGEAIAHVNLGKGNEP